MSDNFPSAASPFHLGLRRRDFLTLGSLAATAPFFEHWAAAAELVGAAIAGKAGSLSIGYLEGSADLRGLARLDPALHAPTVVRRGDVLTTGRRIVPATSLTSGDPRLVGGAVRLAVRGFYPTSGPSSRALPAAVDLDVYVPSLELPAGDGAVFHAWSYRGQPVNHSAPLSFPVWPDWTSDLALSLRVVPSVGAPAQLFHASFTLGNQPARPRLQAGVYLVGLVAGAWSHEVDLPDDPSTLPARLLSVVITATPEGIRS